MIRRSKPLRRTALKPPTPEQVAAFQRKPRRAIPRGKRPARVGRRAKREQRSWEAGRAACVERSGGFCEGPEIAGVHPAGKHSAQHVHHVVGRGRGGGHEPENLIHLCAAIHEHAHRHPAWGESVGLLASRGSARGVVSDS